MARSVFSRSPAELHDRGRQELRKRWDLLAVRCGLPSAPRSNPRRSPPPGRFFFDPGDVPAVCAALHRELPEQTASVLADAEAICRRHFPLLGFDALDFGAELDWQRDIVHGQRAPRDPWFRIPYLSFDAVGDHKIIWELNRHQHLVTLAKACRLSGDARFAEEAVRQWQHWQRENPYPYGINWASSLEVAFRSLSWLWLLQLLAGTTPASDAFRGPMLRALDLSARHIARYLSTYFSPNTHLLGEAVALFFVGTLCPELRDAEAWQRQGWRIILEAAERQVQADGMHFEQSVHYHVYALDFFLHARTLAVRNDMAVPEALDHALERMLSALALLSQPGPPPRFGDDDGGRVFDPRRNRAEHMTDPLAAGAIIFDRPDFKAAAGPLREEALWLLGSDAVERYQKLGTSAPAPSSQALKASGIYLMVSSSAGERLAIDAGPLGAGNGGHGHADALSVELAVGGVPCLVDAGTFTYLGPARDRYRGTAAHNTLELDGLDQAESAGPFAWRRQPQVEVLRWTTSVSFDYFRGIHDGYQRLPMPAMHERRIFRLNNHLFVFLDAASGQGTHRLALNWHLHPSWQSVHEESNHWQFQGPTGTRVALTTAASLAWSASVTASEHSPAYGRAERAPGIRLEANLPLPARVASVWETVPGGAAAGASLQVLADEQGFSAYAYESAGRRREMAFAQGGVPWTLADWRSDAEFAYFGWLQEREQRQILLVGATYLRRNDETVWSAAEAAECELLLTGGIA